MTNKGLRDCVGLLMVGLACTQHPPPTGPVPLVRNAAQQTADSVVRLTTAVARSRASLDAAVHEIHRASGDTAMINVARSRQLRKKAVALDSTYRADLAELLLRVNASIAGESMSNARFSVDAPPVPLVRGFADGSNWMLQSPLIHEIGKNSPYVVIVPRGFVTDFASIPQPLQMLRVRLPMTARYGTAAVAHDYLYWKQDCTRAQADNIMAIALVEAGLSVIERRLIHEGLKQFGQSAWDANRRARQAGLMRTVGSPHDQVPPTGNWAEYREWLRTTRAKEGLEYRVHRSVCAAGDSVWIPR